MNGQPRNDRLLVAATGDIVLTKAASECAADDRVTGLAEVLAGADTVLASLEIPFSDRGRPSDRILNFRAAPALAGELNRFHLSLVTLANNHSSDYGWTALADTMSAMDELGIARIGAGPDLALAEQPHVADIDGTKVGFLAWSCLLPLDTAAGPGRPGIAPIHITTQWDVNGEFQLEEPGVPPIIHTAPRPGDLARASAAITRLRAEVDILVVTVHWGFGFGQDRAEYQRPLGHAFIDAGADIVLGHHVHAPQGVELYEGKAIVYSPGNFVAQQPTEGVSEEILAICAAMSRDGFVSLVRLRADGRLGLALRPIVGNDDGLPGVARGDDFTRISKHLVEACATLDTVAEIHDGLVHIVGP